MEWKQLTLPEKNNKKFPQEICQQINKDFPGCAKVKNNACYISKQYYESCKQYVLDRCRYKQPAKGVSLLIFSKDRPMQLDLLLRSIKDHFPQVDDIFILVKFNEKFNYYNLIQEYRNVKWFTEVNFKKQCIALAEQFQNELCLCLCDDDVIINPIDLDGAYIRQTLEDTVNAFNLRMGENISYSYAQNKSYNKPELEIVKDKYLLWNWTKGDHKSDWNYPNSVAGNIFLKDRLINFWQKLQFKNPNALEGQMNIYRNILKPHTMSFRETKIINFAVNLVQDVCPNRHSGKYTVEELNQKYNNGNRISTSNLYGQVFNSPNTEVEFIFEKRNG